MFKTIAYGISVIGTIATLALRLLGADETLTFGISALTILGLAYVLGHATEQLGLAAGPRIGGIMNATVGNIGEVIIADIEYGRGVGIQRIQRLELKARELQHPDARQCIVLDSIHQGRQRSGGNIAGNFGVVTRRLAQMPGQRRGRRLAVGARNGDHAGHFDNRMQVLQRMSE